MGYPAATGRGTSRANATPTRDLAPTAWRRHNSSRISRRQKFVGSSYLSTGMGRLLFSARHTFHGEGGSRWLRNTRRWVLTASRKNGSPMPAAFSPVH